MTNSRFPLVLAALSLLGVCSNAEAQKVETFSPSAKQRVLSLNFRNDGQHLTTSVGQQIEIILGTVGPKQYGEPHVST